MKANSISTYIRVEKSKIINIVEIRLQLNSRKLLLDGNKFDFTLPYYLDDDLKKKKRSF